MRWELKKKKKHSLYNVSFAFSQRNKQFEIFHSHPHENKEGNPCNQSLMNFSFFLTIWQFSQSSKTWTPSTLILNQSNEIHLTFELGRKVVVNFCWLEFAWGRITKPPMKKAQWRKLTLRIQSISSENLELRDVEFLLSIQFTDNKRDG